MLRLWQMSMLVTSNLAPFAKKVERYVASDFEWQWILSGSGYEGSIGQGP